MTKGKHQRQKENAIKAAEARQEHPPLIQVVEGSQQKQIGEKEKHARQQEPNMGALSKFWKWLNSGANGVIAIFTIVIAAVAFVQALIYIAQLDNMKTSQRAYAYAKSANIFGAEPFPPGAQRQVDVTFGNSGQTWAKEVSTSSNFYFDKDGLPPSFVCPMQEHSPYILLAPQGETHLLKPLSEEQYSSIVNRKFRFFVCGEILYRDVFGASHRTEYLYQLGGMDVDPPTGKIKQYLFWQGPGHNCADDDCKPQNPN
jgi:hypothetical protein